MIKHVTPALFKTSSICNTDESVMGGINLKEKISYRHGASTNHNKPLRHLVDIDVPAEVFLRFRALNEAKALGPK